MWGTRGLLLAVAALLVCGTLSRAQEEAPQFVDCDGPVQQARMELDSQHQQHKQAYEANIAQLTADLQHAQSAHAALQAQKDQEAQLWDAQVQQLRQQVSQADQSKGANEACQAALAEQQGQSATCAASQAQLQASLAAATAAEAGCKAKLAAANAKLAEVGNDLQVLKGMLAAKCKAKTNWTEVFASLSESAKQHFQYAAEELTLVFKGLQQGNTTRLSALAVQISTAAMAAAKDAYAFASRELDEHLPFVKQWAGEAWEKASALYQKHVGEAAWAAEVKKALVKVNDELKIFLTAQIRKQPALKTLDDPVYIQLIAYMLIGAPLLLLALPVLLWLALLAAPASKASAPSGKGAKKKKKAGTTKAKAA